MIKEKLNTIIQTVKQSLAVSLRSLDTKITSFVPNPKTKKILYIAVGSLFGFMFLIMLFGILLSPFRKPLSTETVNVKRILPTSSPDDPRTYTDIQNQILELENVINDLRFPDSNLNIPIVESNLTL